LAGGDWVGAFGRLFVGGGGRTLSGVDVNVLAPAAQGVRIHIDP
jgi:hypothetical protein